MEYKMIVLDLDGTLTNRDKIITPRTKQALMEAQKMGKIVVLASGRPTAGIKPLAEELELAAYGSYILSYNGGMITNCGTGEVVFSSLLPVDSNEKIIGLAEEHRVDILTYEDSRIITNNAECPYGKLESRINSMEVVEKADLASYVDFPVPTNRSPALEKRFAHLSVLPAFFPGDYMHPRLFCGFPAATLSHPKYSVP
mgnify:CR=1 FL=1